MGNRQKSRHLISYQDSGVGIQEIIFIYSPLPSLGSSRFCVISLTYYMIDLCVLCVWCGSLHSLASRTVSQNTFYLPNPKEP
ncbi:MAG: hypothetical protein EWV53_15250, partial [Microcystis panniformis Mp_MB_F_20051200_S9]